MGVENGGKCGGTGSERGANVVVLLKSVGLVCRGWGVNGGCSGVNPDPKHCR